MMKRRILLISSSDEEDALPTDIDSRSINDTFKELYETKKFSDVSFLVHGKELQAHKLVLISRSSVFQAMFKNKLVKEDRKYLIDDPEITFEDFENFMRFMYTDNCSISRDTVRQLMHLSNFYNTKFLATKCIEKIEKWLNNENVLKYAELGYLYAENFSLLDICLSELPKLISKSSLNYKIDKDTFWISSGLALKIAEKCPRTGELTEDALFQKLFNYALQMKNEEKSVNNILEPMLQFIKFEKLEPLTLATIVYNNKLLSAEEYSNVISKAVISNGTTNFPGKQSNWLRFSKNAK